jgi:hypothetical protein
VLIPASSPLLRFTQFVLLKYRPKVAASLEVAALHSP